MVILFDALHVIGFGVMAQAQAWGVGRGDLLQSWGTAQASRGGEIIGGVAELLRLQGWGGHRRGARSGRGEFWGVGQGGTRSRASADRGNMCGECITSTTCRHV